MILVVRLTSTNQNSYIAVKSPYYWQLDSAGNFFVGFRLGYTIGLGTQEWSINGSTFSDSPKASANGLYFGISFSIQ